MCRKKIFFRESRLLTGGVHLEYQTLNRIDNASWTGRLGLLNLLCRYPPLCDGPCYFDALLDDVSQVLDFDDITLFRPQTIGGFGPLQHYEQLVDLVEPFDMHRALVQGRDC